MILSIEELNAAAKMFKTKEVEIKDLGGSVYIRQVTAGELDDLQQMCKAVSQSKCPMFRAKCVVFFLSDENGKRIYTDQQANIVNGFVGRAVDDIFDAGMDFNSVIESPVEELEKN